jgi:signal transduction histidine kinase
LAIVRAIAEAHGGSVAAERSPEGGARIVLELARFSARPAPGRLAGAPLGASA